MRARTPILTDKDVTMATEGALRVLAELGVACTHAAAAERLQEKSPVRLGHGRLRFPRETMEVHFEKKKRDLRTSYGEAAAREDGRFRMGGQWNCLNYLDPETGRHRGATYGEAVRLARLSEALGASGGPIPLAPGDVEPRLKTLVCEKIALLHTQGMGGWLTATDPEEIRLLADMYKAAGRRYALGLEGLITPLSFNPAVFDVYFQWCDDPCVDIGIMGSIPMAGATAPLVFPACLAIPLAEALALDYVFHVLSDGKLSCFDLRLEPFDMKAGSLAFGTPEQCLFIEAMCDFREKLFGIRPLRGTFRTNGKVLDAQTQIERTASFLWQASLGARTFGSVGQMSMDEVYSPAQAILDRETLRYGERLYRGLGDAAFRYDLDIVDIVRQGVEEGGFMVHETTVALFRDFYDMDRLSSASNLATWMAHGSRRLEEIAWDEAQRVADAHTYDLDDVRRRDVETLFERGVRKARA
jgi:trimethylamine:corrinoid methyltransferase-like protein